MDYSQMSREELEAALAERDDAAAAPGPGRYREVTVDGVALTVDLVKLKSWKAFDMVADIEDPGNSGALRTRRVVELVEFVAGLSRDELLSHFGGELAGFEDVSGFCARVIREAGAKN